ncbi:MAG: DUF1569 domain-containing protein [Phycisphaerales bacterium]|nr:MAG: DUF1569 domain-containing protein [Phycisphaerales bacterium]
MNTGAQDIPPRAIDSRRVKDRRALRFETFDDAIADARRCAEADRAGTLRRTGNWTTGQILGHLAWWIDGGFDGYDFKTPWIVRVLTRAFKGVLLRRPIGPGMRMPGAPEGTYGVEKMSTEDGLARFVAAAQRLDRECPDRPNPALGPLTHAQWKHLHLRHAELHLSFLHPEG